MEGIDAAPLIAHAGGWDEILITAAILAFLGYWVLRKRPEDESGNERGKVRLESSTCAYCDARVPPGESRCPTCGFRVRTRKAESKA
jgi:ribosomal protein L40E